MRRRRGWCLVALVAAVVCVVGVGGTRDGEENVLRQLFETRLDLDGNGHVTEVELEAYYVASGSAHHARDEVRAMLSATQRRMAPPHVHNSDGDTADGMVVREFASRFERLDVTTHPARPREVHLALTGDNAEMRVMWVTTDDYTPHSSSVVQWGTQPGVYSGNATGTSFTYTVPKRWWGGFDGFIHEAVMTGLAPATTYYYRVGGIASSASGSTTWSAEFNFTSALPNEAEQPVRFVTYGDQGTVMPLGFAVCDAVIAANAHTNFDMVMHVGDLSYAGTDTNIPFLNITNKDECEWIWDLWGAQIEPLAAHMPYMTGVGNHEKFYNWTAFTHRYHMPTRNGGAGNFWFSFDFGNVHFTSLSTEHPYEVGSPQWVWAREDLRKAVANRVAVPWIVVTGHRPMYCSDESEWDQHRPGAPFQTAIEPLMVEAKVDLLITGHMHCLERIHPVVNGTVVSTPVQDNVYLNPTAAVQVVVGTSGALQEESWITPPPAWSAFRNANNGNSYGYATVETFNSTHLHYEFHPLVPNATAADHFWIVKNQ